MRYFIITILLIASSATLAIDNAQNQCSQFNSIALQLALTQPNMKPPLNLDQIQYILGQNKPEAATVTTTYTWTYKNRVLFASIINNNLSKRFLTGISDGSITSKNMEQAYEKLKTATSIWTIKEIQRQLGTGNVTNNQVYTYSWRCGIGSLVITADQNNINTAIISYRTNQNKEYIETQIGTNHPAWDVIADSSNESYRAWNRMF